ncbi:phage tail tube protein [Enterococcus sp. AZ163]|uniref:phage tail tube protein n=1 Tax=Enterococcus sp. AZ163 TaxID=2774638 RepID=UPI003D2C8DA0
MARQKNAKREHWLAPYVDGQETAPAVAAEDWVRLAKWINTIGDDSNEETEEEGFYDGDGTPETTVMSVAGAYTPEGYYDAEDKAQKMIADMKYLTGTGRKVWHKVVQTNGDTFVGKATVTDIIAGAGDAVTYEEFSCTITFDQAPTKTPKS